MYRSTAQAQYSSDEEDMPHVGAAVEEDHLALTTPLKASDVQRTQTVTLHALFVGSPSDFKQDKTKTVFRIPTHLLKELQDNVAHTDRHLATGADLKGSASRIVPLNLDVVETSSDVPFLVGGRVGGMLDKVLTANDKYAFTVLPGHSERRVNIFHPENPFNSWRYHNATQVTLEDLKDSVKHIDSKIKGAEGRTKIATGSFPHAYLMQRIRERGFTADQLRGTDIDHVMDPGHNQEVEVSRTIGEQIEKEILPIAEDAAKGFIDASNWNVTIHRDGNPDWSSPMNVIGSMVSSKTADASYISTDLMQKKNHVSVTMELTYLTV